MLKQCFAQLKLYFNSEHGILSSPSRHKGYLGLQRMEHQANITAAIKHLDNNEQRRMIGVDRADNRRESRASYYPRVLVKDQVSTSTFQLHCHFLVRIIS